MSAKDGGDFHEMLSTGRNGIKLHILAAATAKSVTDAKLPWSRRAVVTRGCASASAEAAVTLRRWLNSTWCPADANVDTISRPIPALPPVTMTRSGRRGEAEPDGDCVAGMRGRA
jgi:hypothetical protein